MPTVEEIKASRFFYSKVQTHKQALDFIDTHKLPPFTIFLKPTSQPSLMEVVYIDLMPIGNKKNKKGKSQNPEQASCILKKDNGYHFVPRSGSKREPRDIYIEFTEDGVLYEVVDTKGNLKRNTVPWHELPDDFPTDSSDIVNVVLRINFAQINPGE